MGHGIGQGQPGTNPDRRHPVNAREAVLGVVRTNDGHVGAGVGTDTNDVVDAEAKNPAKGIKGHPGPQARITRMGVGQKSLETRRDPFDRDANPLAGKEDCRVLGIGLDLRTETAADMRGQHPQRFWRNSEHLFRKDFPDNHDALCTGDQGQSLCLRIPTGECGARLQCASC